MMQDSSIVADQASLKLVDSALNVPTQRWPSAGIKLRKLWCGSWVTRARRLRIQSTPYYSGLTRTLGCLCRLRIWIVYYSGDRSDRCKDLQYICYSAARDIGSRDIGDI